VNKPAVAAQGKLAPSAAERGGIETQGRLAGIGVVMVMLGISLFAVWSSHATGDSASQAVAASRLSDDYADASDAVAAQESWELEYRLDPGVAAEREFDQAAAAFKTAMRAVKEDGGPSDAALVDKTLVQHQAYVAAAERMFRARDTGDQKAVARIDREQADPAFDAVKESVRTAADDKHQDSLIALGELERLRQQTRLWTPAVFLLGLIVTGLLALVAREYRRTLVCERAQAVHESLHDPLCGLPNRTLLQERLDDALHADRLARTRTALLLIDLDRFKDINDTFGHQYGDELLREVASRLSKGLRDVDTVARLGGDEFAVIVPAVQSLAEAMEVAVRLREALSPSFRVFGVDLNVGASIGVVVSGEHGQNTGTLMQRADIAMYAAKNQGLGVHAYSPDINTHSPERLALVGELREALSNRGLLLHYQPKISVDTGELIGAEALLRWQHPTRGLISAGEFIPLAEHTELIGPLTRYILDAALSQARRWRDAGRPVPVSVNLSARNLLDVRLPDLVSGLLATHELPPELLVLEVTESALMTDPMRARKSLDRLATSGVRISIDDFGAGYTSLSQLKTLPVSELKIDGSFVKTMTDEPVNALIVESVIELGHNLGLSIVAEGVETERALSWLKGMGCDIAQGYHVSPPLVAHAFASHLSKQVSMDRNPDPRRAMDRVAAFKQSREPRALP
jgi:diguanylate cyclase (GGDEF)-like protein